jgi:hypothetical protein
MLPICLLSMGLPVCRHRWLRTEPRLAQLRALLLKEPGIESCQIPSQAIKELAPSKTSDYSVKVLGHAGHNVTPAHGRRLPVL